MKKFLLPIFVLSFSISTALADDEINLNDINLIKTITSSINQLKQPQQTIWPGFKIDEPIVLYFKEDVPRVYAFNNYIPRSGWIYTYSHSWIKNTIDNIDYFYMKGDDVSDDIGFKFFHRYKDITRIEKQQAFIYGIITQDDYDDFIYRRFLSYEKDENSSFKDYISKLKNPKPAYIDDKTNMEYMYLQLEALKEYIIDNNPEALKYYIAINQYRLHLLPNKKSYENRQDILTGSASYVNWKLSNKNEKEYTQAIASRYILPKALAANAANDDVIDQFDNIRYFAQHFYKIVDPLIGSALDTIYKNTWKTTIASGTSTPHALLESSYHLSPVEIDSLTKSACDRYHFNLISQTIDDIFNKFDQVKQMELANYEKLPGVEIEIDIPANTLSNPLTETDGIYIPIDNQTQLWKNGHAESYSWQYWNPHLSSSWIVFDNIPYLFIQHTPTTEAQTILKFKVPGDKELKITYWLRSWLAGFSPTVTINDLLNNQEKYSLYYGKVYLSTPEVEFNITPYDGSINLVDNKVKINFTQLYSLGHIEVNGVKQYMDDNPATEY